MGKKLRFAPAPGINDASGWGIWDRWLRVWTERPVYAREAAERIARKLTKVYEDGAAEAHSGDRGWARGFPFTPAPNPKSSEAWGIWNKKHDRWAEPTLYGEDYAQELAVVFNETYAAGLADAMIEKARRAGPSPSHR